MHDELPRGALGCTRCTRSLCGMSCASSSRIPPALRPSHSKSDALRYRDTESLLARHKTQVNDTSKDLYIHKSCPGILHLDGARDKRQFQCLAQANHIGTRSKPHQATRPNRFVWVCVQAAWRDLCSSFAAHGLHGPLAQLHSKLQRRLTQAICNAIARQGGGDDSWSAWGHSEKGGAPHGAAEDRWGGRGHLEAVAVLQELLRAPMELILEFKANSGASEKLRANGNASVVRISLSVDTCHAARQLRLLCGPGLCVAKGPRGPQGQGRPSRGGCGFIRAAGGSSWSSKTPSGCLRS
jgi:hypothetical protein